MSKENAKISRNLLRKSRSRTGISKIRRGEMSDLQPKFWHFIRQAMILFIIFAIRFRTGSYA